MDGHQGADARRLDFMRRLPLDDAEEAFASIADLAGRLVGVKIAYVALAAGADRLWLSPLEGRPADFRPLSETPSVESFQWRESRWIEDLHQAKDRFASGARSRRPDWRLHASAPIRLPAGPGVGTLVVASEHPLALDSRLLEGLEALASLAGRQAEQATRLKELEMARDEARADGERLEGALSAAQAAAAAKSDLLAFVSHEIRTPMSGVEGVLHLLGAEPLTDDGRHLLAEALACAKMLGQLVNDVLDLSRIEAGKLQLSTELTDPKEAVDGVIRLLLGQAEAKGLYLHAEMEPGLGWISTDPVRLRQCLFNLIGNAVKFTASGGVRVRLARPAGDRLRVEVEDTGAGIPHEAQARLFQRFEQADLATRRQHGGAGLGLAISKTLVGMMGGDIGVQSVEGRGSTFWFELAAPAYPAPPQKRPASAGQGLVGARVLLVDDHAANRLIVGRILEALGAVVLTSPDGCSAIEAVENAPLDLVLMDINMPGMDGAEATRRIRALPGPAAKVPIIALTADVLTHPRQTLEAAGMNGVIPKPISPETLLSGIARLLARPEGAIPGDAG